MDHRRLVQTISSLFCLQILLTHFWALRMEHVVILVYLVPVICSKQYTGPLTLTRILGGIENKG